MKIIISIATQLLAPPKQNKISSTMNMTTNSRRFSPLIVSLILLLITLTSFAATEQCNPEDKKVLLGIKEWFNNAYHFASWSNSTDCCKDWYMVKCDLTTHRIISLTVFTDNNVTGTIPPTVGDLPYLQTLFFRKLPNLTGTIPSTITKLKYLEIALFDHNSLSGPIPSFFSTMVSLQQLDLSFNSFSGSIPPQLALAPALIYLDISRNLLTGPIPDSFGYFNQSGNSFGLIFSHNQLSGPIPTSMANMNFLQIDFSRNNLTGDASFLFGINKTIQLLFLERNQLSFDFSGVDIPSGLTSLDLSHNKVYGSLPSTGWESVNFLNVSYNRLCGPIPNVGSLQSFDQSVYVHNKCLCGPPLPACNSTA